MVVLSAYAAKSAYRPVFIKLTFILVCLTVLLVSLALARAADTLPVADIRYLGLVPIGIGVYHLAKLILGRLSSDDAAPEVPPDQIGLAGYLGFALALMTNSGDSVIILAPLLADLKPVFVLITFSAAVAVAILMSYLADLLVHQPALRSSVDKVSNWVLPFLLITIGVLILTDHPTDVFVE